MKSPIAIANAPKMTVQRTPYQSASRPITTPPKEVPSQASELASEGAARAPPRSAAIAFSPTAVIQGAPKETAIRTTDTVATTQEVRESMEGLSNGGSDQLE